MHLAYFVSLAWRGLDWVNHIDLHKVRTENRAVVGTRAWHKAGVKCRTQIPRITLFKVLNHGKDLVTQISRIALFKVLNHGKDLVTQISRIALFKVLNHGKDLVTQISRISLFKVLNHGKDLLTQISRIALLKVLNHGKIRVYGNFNKHFMYANYLVPYIVIKWKIII